MSRTAKVAVGALSLLAALVVALLAWARATTLHPEDVELVDVECSGGAPTLRSGQEFEVMSWNVQYMASKNYTFFYDLRDNSGPDTRPSPEHITQTLEEVARVIADEDPDVVLLQEVDEGAARTDLEDQTERLLELLGDRYACRAEAFYWKADFVPDPNVFGPVGLKLVTLSRYRIDGASRIALAEVPKDPVTQLFYLKRAILSATLPVLGAKKGLSVMNTHLAAFAQGDDTMARQVREIVEQTEAREATHEGWIIGGDFNLLAPHADAGAQAKGSPAPSYERLNEYERGYYNPQTELDALYRDGSTPRGVQSVPSLEQINSAQAAEFFTFYPNNRSDGPDRTIDYVFMPSDMVLLEGRVRHHDTLAISDHLPVLATVRVP